MKKIIMIIATLLPLMGAENLSYEEIINSSWGPSDFKSSVKFDDEFEEMSPTCNRIYEILYNGEFDYRQGVFKIPSSVKRYAVLRYQEHILNMEDYHKDNSTREELIAKVTAIRDTKGCFKQHPALARIIGDILIETIKKLKGMKDD